MTWELWWLPCCAAHLECVLMACTFGSPWWASAASAFQVATTYVIIRNWEE